MKHEVVEQESVGIVGYGFVGRAVKSLFPNAHVYDKFNEVFSDTYDKNKVLGCSIVFVCVPTDMLPDGSCDLSAVRDVLSWIGRDQVVVLKSTVPPTEVARLPGTLRIVANPEFLTERNWKNDIMNETRVILGGERTACNRVRNLYRSVYAPTTEYWFTDHETAMLAKYATNAFLAMKVTLSNVLYDYCDDIGVRYDDLRDMWTRDERVGRGHTDVTDRRGFGGYCLPKDTAALAVMTQSEVLDSIINYNERIRS